MTFGGRGAASATGEATQASSRRVEKREDKCMVLGKLRQPFGVFISSWAQAPTLNGYFLIFCHAGAEALISQYVQAFREALVRIS